jgi:hypothetical protein
MCPLMPSLGWWTYLQGVQFKFFYTSPGAHTLESRGAPSPAKAVARAINALYEIPLPPIAEGFGTFKLREEPPATIDPSSFVPSMG